MASATLPRAVLFDLDGTLVDTAPDLCRAVNHVLAGMDRPAVPLARLREVVSKGGRAMLAVALPDLADDAREALLARHGLTGAQLAAGAPGGDALLRDWAATLLAAMPEAFDGQPLYRRLRGGLDRAALRRLAAGRGFAPEAAPVTVWRAWRLARRR